jgi:hypothetical protein
MLLVGIAALALANRSPSVLISLSVAGTAMAVALARSVPLPPVPFVESIIPAALGHGLAASALALTGLLLMFAPPLAMRAIAPAAITLGFAGVWLGALAAALVGAYPTPVIGLGGSAILGFLLSVALLTLSPVPRATSSARREPEAESGADRLKLRAA